MRKILVFVIFSAALSFGQTFSGRAGSDVRVTPPFKWCLGEDNGKDACFYQTGNNLAYLAGRLNFGLAQSTVANLPPAIANQGRVYQVTDGLSSSDCTSGNGTAAAICVSDGSQWVTIGGGGLPNPATFVGNVNILGNSNLSPAVNISGMSSMNFNPDPWCSTFPAGAQDSLCDWNGMLVWNPVGVGLSGYALMEVCQTDYQNTQQPVNGTIYAWSSSQQCFAQTTPTPKVTPGTSVTLTAPTQYFVCTGTCTVAVPVPSAGYQFCVYNDDNVSTVITLSALGSSARYENQARTAYGTAGTGTFVSGGAAKDFVCILGRDATHYLTTSSNGTWTAN